jgi:peptide deformylase
MMGDPVLREKCKKVGRVTKGLRTLVDDMVDTMHDANGVGLAAPQVGVPVRIIVAQLPDDVEDDPAAGKLFVVYNPEIVKSSGEHFPEEGCLSIPGYVANVRRALNVVVTGKDRRGRDQRVRASGRLAQVFQHEIDHVDGVLFIDHLDSLDELRKVERDLEPEAEAAATA